MLALAQGPIDLAISVTFIVTAVGVIHAADRIVDHFRPRRRIANQPSAPRPTGLVRVIRPDDVDA